MIARLGAAAGALLAAVAALLLLSLLIVVLLGVGARGFAHPLAWSEEAAQHLLVWVGFVGLVMAARNRSHIRIEALLGLPSDRVRTRNALNAGEPLAMQRDGGAYVQTLRRACNITMPAKNRMAGFDKVRRTILRSMERSA